MGRLFIFSCVREVENGVDVLIEDTAYPSSLSKAAHSQKD